MKEKLPLYLSVAGVLLFCLLLVGYVFYMNYSAGDSLSDDLSEMNDVPISQEEAAETLDLFANALKVYNIDEMSKYLSTFPNKSRDGTLDDIYNDAEYLQLYRTLYPSLTYEIKSYSENCATVSVTMADIKTLYQNASMKLQLGALNNEDLKNKLLENDSNAIVLFKQLMLYDATETKNVQQMTREYNLTFDRSGKKIQIIADDQLCAFLTGDFSTARNSQNDVVE